MGALEVAPVKRRPVAQDRQVRELPPVAQERRVGPRALRAAPLQVAPGRAGRAVAREVWRARLERAEGELRVSLGAQEERPAVE